MGMGMGVGVGVGGLSHQRSGETRDCLCLLGQDRTCPSADRHMKTHQLLDKCAILLGGVGLDSTRRPISRLVPGQIDQSLRPRSLSDTCPRALHTCYWPRNLGAPCESPNQQLHCPSCEHGMWPSMVSGRSLTRELVVLILVHQRAASRIGRQIAHERRLLRAAKLIEAASRRRSPLEGWISTKLSLKEG